MVLCARKVDEITAWIVGLWFLMPAIIYPLNALGIPPFRSIIILIMLLIVLVVNNFSINRNMAIFICIYLLLIIFKMMVYTETLVDFVQYYELWISTIFFGVISCILASMPYDAINVINKMYKISRLAVMEIVLCVNNDSFLSSAKLMNGWYMTLGFGLMLPLAVMVIYFWRNGFVNNKIGMLIYASGLITLILYGNRGAWMCHVALYGLVFVLYSYKHNIMKRNFLYLMIGVTFLLGIFDVIGGKCIEWIEGYFGGDVPYSWMKIIHVYKLENLNEFTSGRDIIYEYAFDSLKENTLWGNYIGFIHKVSSSTHNIFLEIACDYGVIVLCVFLMVMLYRVYVFIKLRGIDDKLLLIIFASCACEQMTSGYMFFQNNFMFLVGFLMTSRCTKG